MNTFHDGGCQRISFQDFLRTRSAERLRAGLRCLESEYRTWKPDDLVDHAYMVYARNLVAHALEENGGVVGPPVREPVRRMKWTMDEVRNFMDDLSDNYMPELATYGWATGEAISAALDWAVADAWNRRWKRK